MAQPHTPARQVRLEGWGLHTGVPSRVTLSARATGTPIVVRALGREAQIGELAVSGTRRATTVERATPEGLLRVATVEHLFAALAGLGIRGGLAVDVEGPELPLLDGGAARWTEALEDLGLAAEPPPLRIARAQTIDAGASRYELRPGAASVVEVVIAFDDDRLEPAARWSGDPRDFRDRIAPARTFALARDVDELLALGLAKHVAPTSVVVLGPNAVHFAGAAFTADEPARHKLLDLLGDLYLCGGPPLGTVRAFRPGHAANAEAVRVALAEGLFVAR
jgi:UDP-3-O-[3-hydroxymyristoyl] N-acetylglucosamine deacetylase